VAAGAAALVLLGCGSPADRSSRPPPAAVPAAGGTAARSNAAPEPLPSPPVRLSIASLGVDAPVEAVGLDGEGRMATPSQPSHVAWYRPGPAPGQPGDAVIDGHLDWTNGPAVFFHLDRLRVGDEVVVLQSSGGRLRFAVDSISTIPFESPLDAYFTTSGPPSLTLITCTGSWDRQRQTYLQRLVVHTSLPPAPPSEKPGDAG
jgi:LPXTG-site transpeptidase (sortase) family protein